MSATRKVSGCRCPSWASRRGGSATRRPVDAPLDAEAHVQLVVHRRCLALGHHPHVYPVGDVGVPGGLLGRLACEGHRAGRPPAAVELLDFRQVFPRNDELSLLVAGVLLPGVDARQPLYLGMRRHADPARRIPYIIHRRRSCAHTRRTPTGSTVR